MIPLLPQAQPDFLFLHLGLRRRQQSLSALFKLVDAELEACGVG
jgi:hypothetical protein